jgi:hypothetical protein
MPKKFAGFAFSEQSARMTVQHPVTLEPLVNKDTGEECWVELLPLNGERGNAIDRQITDKQLRRRVQRLTAKDVEGNAIERLAGVTLNWMLCDLNGNPMRLPFSTDLAAEVYGEVRWLRDQVATFAADLGNFQSTSSGTSSGLPSTSSDSSS